jgi:hypothetical protein
MDLAVVSGDGIRTYLKWPRDTVEYQRYDFHRIKSAAICLIYGLTAYKLCDIELPEVPSFVPNIKHIRNVNKQQMLFGGIVKVNSTFVWSGRMRKWRRDRVSLNIHVYDGLDMIKTDDQVVSAFATASKALRHSRAIERMSKDLTAVSTDISKLFAENDAKRRAVSMARSMVSASTCQLELSGGIACATRSISRLDDLIRICTNESCNLRTRIRSESQDMVSVMRSLSTFQPTASRQ